MSYAGEPGGLKFTGIADDRGRVNVSISRSRQSANDSGRGRPNSAVNENGTRAVIADAVNSC